MKIVPYEPWHFRAFPLRDYEKSFQTMLGVPDNYPELLQGLAFTFMEEVPVGCIGVLDLWPGVGEAWLSLSTRFEIGRPSRRWAELSRLIRREFDTAMKIRHRIHTAIPLDFEPGHRFVRHVGFVDEGIRRKYGPDGSDYLAFVRL